jgi:hypothetical protein
MLEKGDIARVIKGHFRMENLMAPSSYDHYASEKRDSWDYEDQRDATLGGCGFPWEKDEDGEFKPDTSKYELGFVAMLLVDEMFGWDDAPASEYRQFLKDCGFNEETIAKLVPDYYEGKPTEFILSY